MILSQSLRAAHYYSRDSTDYTDGCRRNNRERPVDIPEADDPCAVRLEGEYLPKVKAEIVGRAFRTKQLSAAESVDAPSVISAVPVGGIIGVPLLAPQRRPFGVLEQPPDDVLRPKIPEDLVKE